MSKNSNNDINVMLAALIEQVTAIASTLSVSRIPSLLKINEI